MKTFLHILFSLLFIVQLISCKKIDRLKPKSNADFGDVNTGVGVNEIVAIPEGAHKKIKANFSRYTKLSSTSDLPIHIIAQSDVNDETILRVKDVLSSFLKNVADTKYGYDKLLISDKIAENKGTIAIFNSQLEMETTISELTEVDLNILFLSGSDIVFEYSEDYLNNNAVDYSFGKIAAFILEFGTKEVYPEYFKEVKNAAKNAVDNNFWFSLSIPEWQNDDNVLTSKYYAVLIASYYDFWANTSNGFGNNNNYAFNSREALILGDINSFNAMENFFSSEIKININLNLPDDTIFSLTYSNKYPYSFKSKHLTNLTLLGENDIDIIGNQFDNVISGNNGINTFYLSGKYNEYVISKRGIATTITDTVELRDGQDAIEHFEHMLFSDTLVDVN